MISARALIVVTLPLLGLAACASQPAQTQQARACTNAAPGNVVYVTGSNIPQPVDPKTCRPQSMSPMETVTSDDMQKTGRTDLSTSLQVLLPSAH